MSFGSPVLRAFFLLFDHGGKGKSVKQKDMQEFLHLASVFQFGLGGLMRAFISVDPDFVRPSRQFVGQQVFIPQLPDALGKSARQVAELFPERNFERLADQHARAVQTFFPETFRRLEIKPLDVGRQSVGRFDGRSFREMLDGFKKGMDIPVDMLRKPRLIGEALCNHTGMATRTLEKHPADFFFFRVILGLKQESRVFR